MIVGRTLTSLLYAWRLQKKCILLEPLLFHTLSDEYDGINFEEFGVDNAEELLNNLLFIMGVTNLLLYQGEVASFRPEDNTIVTNRNTRRKLEGEIEIFDGEELDEYEVFDSFYWRAGLPHDRKIVETDDDFCSRIVFYESKRNGTRSVVKDFTVVSRMTYEQLVSPDYSNGMARIKTQRIFKSEDIKGSFVMQKGDKRYYRKVEFDFASRKAVPRIEQKMNFKEVFQMKQEEGEEWTMWKRLMSKEKTWLG